MTYDDDDFEPPDDAAWIWALGYVLSTVLFCIGLLAIGIAVWP